MDGVPDFKVELDPDREEKPASPDPSRIVAYTSGGAGGVMTSRFAGTQRGAEASLKTHERFRELSKEQQEAAARRRNAALATRPK